MLAYYNEFDKDAAAWLRELIRCGLVMEGDVDERSICEVQPSDLKGYTRHHFFAGIGGWDYALQLAGWPDNQPVWTGSCPCQPFSAAGKQEGVADKRHLWPEFFRLIRECRPECIFGEQVASAIGKGWLDGVSTDLETEGYACGSVVLGAHSVGADHIRQRLYWVADTELHGHSPAKRGCNSGEGEDGGRVQQSAGACHVCGVANNNNKRSQRRDGAELCERGVECVAREGVPYGGVALPPSGEMGSARFPWGNGNAVVCRDGKHRRIPTEPAFFPLADGVPARVVRLRGYGNAIVPQVAAAFIEAYMQARTGLA